MPGSVIGAGARTSIGKLSGALGNFPRRGAGGLAISAALARAGVPANDVDYVIMGQVLLARAGQLPARQAAVAAGILMTVPAVVAAVAAVAANKVCLSRLNAIYQADLMIAAGDAEVVVAGGQESMTQAPQFVAGARAGLRPDDATFHESLGRRIPGHHPRRLEELSGLSHSRDRRTARAAARAARFNLNVAPPHMPRRSADQPCPITTAPWPRCRWATGRVPVWRAGGPGCGRS
jgi:acetyl-CoA C-acetyltransferase